MLCGDLHLQGFELLVLFALLWLDNADKDIFADSRGQWYCFCCVWPDLVNAISNEHLDRLPSY